LCERLKWGRAILKAVQDLAENFTDEVAAQINGILHDIQTGESTKPNLQELLEQTQQ
jgi:site-specific DNA recombinase